MRSVLLALLALIAPGCADGRPIVLDPPAPIVDPRPAPLPTPTPVVEPTTTQESLLAIVRSIEGTLPRPVEDLVPMLGEGWRDERFPDGAIVRTWPGPLNVYAVVRDGLVREVHAR